MGRLFGLTFRHIRFGRLFVSGLIYRALVIACDVVFFVFGLEPIIERAGYVVAAIAMNVFTLILYYAYHLAFAKLFRLGKNSC